MHFTIEKAPSGSATNENRTRCKSTLLSSRAGSQRGHGAKPSFFRGKLCGIQNQAVRRLQHARGIVRPLEIAAHPVQTVGNAGKHVSQFLNLLHSQFCKTQVSFEPPP